MIPLEQTRITTMLFVAILVTTAAYAARTPMHLCKNPWRYKAASPCGDRASAERFERCALSSGLEVYGKAQHNMFVVVPTHGGAECVRKTTCSELGFSSPEDLRYLDARMMEALRGTPFDPAHL
jgi:hypothetical protein